MNAGCKVNSVQVELLKGAMAGDAYSNGLTATAEHIIATISNANWIDRELMRQFFLEKVGFGSKLSLRSGSLCVERGIPSPQRLAMLFHTETEAPSWLRLTEEETMLLRIALSPFIEQQRKHLGERDDGPDAVWVDVDSSEADSSDAASCLSDDSSCTDQTSKAGNKDDSTSLPTLLLARNEAAVTSPLSLPRSGCPNAPPSTPQEPQEEELQTSSNQLFHSPRLGCYGASWSASASSFATACVDGSQCPEDASFVSALATDPRATTANMDRTATIDRLSSAGPSVQMEQRAVCLRLSLPSELEELSPLDSTPDTSSLGDERAALLKSNYSDNPALTFTEPGGHESPSKLRSERGESKEDISAPTFFFPAASMMSSYGSCSLPGAAPTTLNALQHKRSSSIKVRILPPPMLDPLSVPQQREVEGAVRSGRSDSTSTYSSCSSSYGSCALLGYYHATTTANNSNHYFSPLDLDAQADADWLSTPTSSPQSTPRTPRTPVAGVASSEVVLAAAASPLTVSATSWVTDRCNTSNGRDDDRDDKEAEEDTYKGHQDEPVPVRASNTY